MEVQILRFYLKVFSFFLIFVIYFFYIFLVKEINLKNDYFFIKKNENYRNIINNNIIDNNINLFFYKLSLKTLLSVNKKIHFGKFKLKEKPTYYQILKSIVSPSNIYNKITLLLFFIFFVTVFFSESTELVGFTIYLKIISCPEEIPPSIPPAWLL